MVADIRWWARKCRPQDPDLGGKFDQGAGAITEQSVNDEYLSRITEDVPPAREFQRGGRWRQRCGSRVQWPMRMLEEMGCTVSPLYLRC